MAQPVWRIAPGDLGIFPSGTPISIQLQASPVAPANTISFKLLNGSLPLGNFSLSSTGLISGTPAVKIEESIYTFTVRITDNLGNIKDGTFTIGVYGSDGVKFLTTPGEILNINDSEYVKFQLDYIHIPEDVPLVSITSGKLPPGLMLDSFGLITGWASPPVLPDRSPTARSYEFTVKLTNSFGVDSQTYSIFVNNIQTTNLQQKRRPAILNAQPLQLPLQRTDEFYSYYTLSSDEIGPIEAGKNFTFKVLGYDFDKQDLTYVFSAMPPGLVGDSVTGWVTGTPDVTLGTAIVYSFNVKVFKTAYPSYESDTKTFTLTVRNNVEQLIEWKTETDLGTYNNGTVCHLKVEATADVDLRYVVSNGNLPPNILLHETGELIGRFPFQPDTVSTSLGESTTFTFDITAFSRVSNGIYNTKRFTITVKQRFEHPVETVYFKASPGVDNRKILQTLITSEALIPNEFLFRPFDNNFGRATEVRLNHQYCVVSKSTSTYLNALVNNHYRQRFIINELHTALARDENNNELYEVVYATFKDSGTNDLGQSVPKNIAWPQDIGLRYGDWYDSKTDIYTSNTNVYSSFSPSYIKTIAPTSLKNMRDELTSNLEIDFDETMLPKWMTSQQRDGSVLGFVPAWVVCYTLPGKSETIKSNIENYWAYNLSDIDFEVDRVLVDRSMTFNWNTTLVEPNWSNLPSAFPAPSPLNQYDDIVLFKQQTILPIIE